MSITHDGWEAGHPAELVRWQDILTLDCKMNVVNVHKVNKCIILSESQKRLLLCLINNIHCKKKIMQIVWHECHDKIKDNNYHQLVFQFRAMLSRNALPSNLIITIPHRGLMLNANAFEMPSASHPDHYEQEGQQGKPFLRWFFGKG
jgi:hypothetical protein